MAGGLVFAGQGGALPRGVEAEQEEEGELEGKCAGGVEEDVGEGAGAVGEECLVKFIGACDECGGGDGEGVAGERELEAALEFCELVAEGEPEGAEADKGECSVAEKVPGFAEEVVEVAPILVEGGAEKGLAEAVEGSGGAVRAEGGGGFKGEDSGAKQDGKPGAEEGVAAAGGWLSGVGKEAGC